MVAFKLAKNLFFVNGYAKSDIRGTGREIADDVLDAYRKFAADLLALTPAQIDAQKSANNLREVECNG